MELKLNFIRLHFGLVCFCMSFFCLLQESLQAQCQQPIRLTERTSLFTNPAFGIAVSVKMDRLDRSILYLASKNAGIKIYDLTDSLNPQLISSILSSDLENLDAIQIIQKEHELYVCLGDIWNTDQEAGLAIIDVSDVKVPKVLDVYKHPGSMGGAAAAFVDDNTVYLAAMRNGLIVLDVSNPNSIRLKGQVLFSNAFPHSDSSNVAAYNARGICVKDQFAFVCYDRGGLRIVDLSDPTHPVEKASYCNPALVNKATAYNAIAIDQNHAFVSLDYYGVEVLDISDPIHCSKIGWWHPTTWADTTNQFNIWANSRGHANELLYDSICKKLYVAAGRTDLAVIDVADPRDPQSCGQYGFEDDDYGTWGCDFYKNKIAVSYIWSPFFPPYSNYTGFRELNADDCLILNTLNSQSTELNAQLVYDSRTRQLKLIFNKEYHHLNIQLFSIDGKEICRKKINHQSSCEFSLEYISGVYFVRMMDGKQEKVIKLVL